LSIKNFIPTVWSAKVFQELDKAHVLVPLCNRDYEGEIRNFGDTVKINSIGDITVFDYAPNVTSITPEMLAASQTVLEIDKAKGFAFYIDDVDNAQTNPKLMSEAMRKSAYALADVSDKIIAGFYTAAGSSCGSTGIYSDGTGALAVLSDAARELDEANVPSQGRWIVVPPWFHQRMILAEILQTDGSIVADVSYRNGFVGKAFGFDVYMSNNLSTGISTLGTRSHYGLAGTQRAMSFAEQVVKVEAYRPENSFSDAVKGLHVYGAKVIAPDSLVRVNISDTGM
jgi:hypothetical protein